MITVKSMQILYRQTALLQSILTHKTKVKLIINGIKTYMSSEANIKQRLSFWNIDAFPKIQMPINCNSYNLQFVFFRNDTQVGRARCVTYPGNNKKDCLDIADRKFNIIGKFLYQIIWRSGQPQQVYGYSPQVYIKQTLNTNINKNVKSQQNNISTYQNYPNLSVYQPHSSPYDNYYQNNNNQFVSQYKPPNLNQPYFKYSQNQGNNIQSQYNISNSTNNNKSKNSKKNVGFLKGMFGGCMGCGMIKRKPKMPYFAIQPVVISQLDLPYAETLENVQPFSIQYYSKPII